MSTTVNALLLDFGTTDVNNKSPNRSHHQHSLLNLDDNNNTNNNPYHHVMNTNSVHSSSSSNLLIDSNNNSFNNPTTSNNTLQSSLQKAIEQKQEEIFKIQKNIIHVRYNTKLTTEQVKRNLKIHMGELYLVENELKTLRLIEFNEWMSQLNLTSLQKKSQQEKLIDWPPKTIGEPAVIIDTHFTHSLNTTLINDVVNPIDNTLQKTDNTDNTLQNTDNNNTQQETTTSLQRWHKAFNTITATNRLNQTVVDNERLQRAEEILNKPLTNQMKNEILELRKTLVILNNKKSLNKKQELLKEQVIGKLKSLEKLYHDHLQI